MGLTELGARSLWNRRFVAALTVITIAISTAMVIGVERIRHNAHLSFASTVSGADLIVGARTGAIQLLLYSVFRVGNATNNISWKSYQDIASQPGVKWTIPLSLGDSHRGYRVMGTNSDYFAHFRYADQRSLAMEEGTQFDGLFEVVIGAEIAQQLDYRIGQHIVLSHGLGATSFSNHDDKPFRIAGILERTGTPVDQTLHVSLEAIEAIHIDWQGGVRIPGSAVDTDQLRNMQLQPKAITAFVVGLESRIGVFGLQRFVNEYPEEPLLAILPGVALQQLWDLMGVAEKALLVVAIFVVLAAFSGLIAVSLAGLNERRREIAILRAIGASYHHIVALLVVESMILTVIGITLGIAIMITGLHVASPWVESRLGLAIPIGSPTITELKIVGGLLLAGSLAGLVPAWRAYRNALADGLTANT